MRRLIALLLLTGCSGTDPKVLQVVSMHDKILRALVPAHNRLITCQIEARKFDDVKPCLSPTPTPEDQK